jgi:hypothetical protein
MAIDNKYLKQLIKEKNYSKCIYILTVEITNLLIDLIKIKKEDFEYVNLANLKSNAIKFLDDNLANVAIDFYNLTIRDDDDEFYELSMLFEIYATLLNYKK